MDMIKCALHQVLRLRNDILSPDYFIFITIVVTFLTACVQPNPLRQLFLWEESGAPGENLRLSLER